MRCRRPAVVQHVRVARAGALVPRHVRARAGLAAPPRAYTRTALGTHHATGREGWRELRTGQSLQYMEIDSLESLLEV